MLKAPLALVLLLLAARPAAAQARVDRNVVYGMYSGLALLMDVHHPAKPNGRGVIYPAALEDVQRAVRYVRHNAQAFGIDAAHLGGVGGSSGAHLVGLVAMRADAGLPDDPDPANRQPATLQAIVLRAGPSDLLQMKGALSLATVVSFMERLPIEQKLFREASPVTHVSRKAPPVLLAHGDADDTVPYDQSVAFERALRDTGVPVSLLRVEGGVHGPNFGPPGKPHPRFPEVLAAMVSWLDEHLRSPATTATGR